MKTKYKNSGIEWMGLVPKEWVIKPVKRLFRIVNGATPTSTVPEYWDGNIPWVTPDDLGNNSSMIVNDTRRQITEQGYNSCGTTLIPEGSLVMSTRAPIGYLAIAGKPMCSNQGCKSLVPLSDTKVKYYYYFFTASKDYIAIFGKGSTFKELSRDDLANIPALEPVKDETDRITKLLDEKTSRIDDLIAKKESMIELLKEQRAAVINEAVTKGLDKNVKMKDSGVEWCPRIASKWQMCPVKANFDIQLGKMLQNEAASNLDEKVPYMKALHVNWDVIQIDELPEMWASPKDIIQYGVKHMDLLVCEGGEVGRAGIVFNPPDKCIIQNALHRVRAKNDAQTSYLLYVLIAIASADWFSVLCNKATIAHFTRDKFSELRIPNPSGIEQIEIVKYLDAKTKKINEIIRKEEMGIVFLKELRTAITSYVVTGKADVFNV